MLLVYPHTHSFKLPLHSLLISEFVLQGQRKCFIHSMVNVLRRRKTSSLLILVCVSHVPVLSSSIYSNSCFWAFMVYGSGMFTNSVHTNKHPRRKATAQLVQGNCFAYFSTSPLSVCLSSCLPVFLLNFSVCLLGLTRVVTYLCLYTTEESGALLFLCQDSFISYQKWWLIVQTTLTMGIVYIIEKALNLVVVMSKLVIGILVLIV